MNAHSPYRRDLLTGTSVLIGYAAVVKAYGDEKPGFHPAISMRYWHRTGEFADDRHRVTSTVEVKP